MKIDPKNTCDMISVMTEQVGDYNKALSRISAMLPVRRSTDSAFISTQGQLVQALLEVRAGSSVMFTPIMAGTKPDQWLIRGELESVNYSPKE